MEKIDWFGINERSLRKYENFTAALAALGMALEESDKLVKRYTAAAPATSGAYSFLRVEPEELKGAQTDLYESLNTLVAKARRHEAKLKSWEWQL